MPHSEPASDKFFRILRFFAPTVCAIRHERGRVIRSFVHSFVRSLLAKRTSGSTYASRCGAPASANRYALSSSLLYPVPRLSPTVGGPRFPTPSVFVAERFLARRFSAVDGRFALPPIRRRFYLIALLCFIEQLLCSRAVCFFTVTTGNSCVCDFWV